MTALSSSYELSEWSNDATYTPANASWRSPLAFRARQRTKQEGEGVLSDLGPSLGHCHSLVAHNESNYVLFGGTGRKQTLARIYDLSEVTEDMEPVSSFRTSKGSVAMDWKADILANANTKGEVEIYLVDPGSPPEEPALHVSLKTNVEEHAPILNELHLPNYCNSVNLLADSDHLKLLATKGNQILLWDLAEELSGEGKYPIASCSMKHATMCASWAPHLSSPHFMVASSRSALKLCDLRLLGSEHSPVVWKKSRAHSHIIRDIKWSPFVPFWCATAGDDGVVNVWDLRKNSEPMVVLDDHHNAVRSVDWSPTHADVLASGGSDQRTYIWNLRLEPHYLLSHASAPFTSTNNTPSFPSAPSSPFGSAPHTPTSPKYVPSFAGMPLSPMASGSGAVSTPSFVRSSLITEPFSSVVGCAWTWGSSQKLVSATTEGKMFATTLTPSFLSPLAPTRPHLALVGTEMMEEVEKAIYMRDFTSAFTKAHKVAERYRDSGQIQEAFQVLDICYQRVNPANDVDELQDDLLDPNYSFTVAQFQKELETYSYHIPPSYPDHLWPEVASSVMFSIQSLKIAIEIKQFLSNDQFAAVFAYSEEIIEALERDSYSFSPSFLMEIACALIKVNFAETLKLVIAVATAFEKSGELNRISSLLHLFLYPTIFEMPPTKKLGIRVSIQLPAARVELTPVLKTILLPGNAVGQLRFLLDSHLHLYKLDSTTETHVNLLLSPPELPSPVLPVAHYKTLFAALLRLQKWDLLFLEGDKVLKAMADRGDDKSPSLYNEMSSLLADGIDSLKARVEALVLDDEMDESDQFEEVVRTIGSLAVVYQRVEIFDITRLHILLRQLDQNLAFCLTSLKTELSSSAIKKITRRAEDALLGRLQLKSFTELTPALGHHLVPSLNRLQSFSHPNKDPLPRPDAPTPSSTSLISPRRRSSVTSPRRRSSASSKGTEPIVIVESPRKEPRKRKDSGSVSDKNKHKGQHQKKLSSRSLSSGDSQLSSGQKTHRRRHSREQSEGSGDSGDFMVKSSPPELAAVPESPQPNAEKRAEKNEARKLAKKMEKEKQKEQEKQEREAREREKVKEEQEEKQKREQEAEEKQKEQNEENGKEEQKKENETEKKSEDHEEEQRKEKEKKKKKEKAKEKEEEKRRADLLRKEEEEAARVEEERVKEEAKKAMDEKLKQEAEAEKQEKEMERVQREKSEQAELQKKAEEEEMRRKELKEKEKLEKERLQQEKEEREKEEERKRVEKKEKEDKERKEKEEKEKQEKEEKEKKEKEDKERKEKEKREKEEAELKAKEIKEKEKKEKKDKREKAKEKEKEKKTHHKKERTSSVAILPILTPIPPLEKGAEFLLAVQVRKVMPSIPPSDEGKRNCYVIAKVNRVKLKTQPIESLNPEWNETLYFQISRAPRNVSFTLEDDVIGAPEFLGQGNVEWATVTKELNAPLDTSLSFDVNDTSVSLSLSLTLFDKEGLVAVSSPLPRKVSRAKSLKRESSKRLNTGDGDESSHGHHKRKHSSRTLLKGESKKTKVPSRSGSKKQSESESEPEKKEEKKEKKEKKEKEEGKETREDKKKHRNSEKETDKKKEKGKGGKKGKGKHKKK